MVKSLSKDTLTQELPLENLKITYRESVEIHRAQQAAIDLIYNKLNWILVSDIVFLAAIYNSRSQNMAVVLLVSTSAILSIIGLDPQNFKTTARLSEQLNKINSKGFLKDLIDKKIEAFNTNKSTISHIGSFLTFSKWSLIVALILQVILLIV